MRPFFVFCLLILSSDLSSQESETGRFFREHWYEPGLENGNPNSLFNSRFRVNAPEVVIHETFHSRNEPRGNGLMMIRAEEDLTRIRGARLYCELWGGHPGTAWKRVTVNGRRTLPIQEVGTMEGHCTHQFPMLPLRPTDLVNGFNAIQFACETEATFWGHFIVDEAALLVELQNDHPDLVEAGVGELKAEVVTAGNRPEKETIVLHLRLSGVDSTAVQSVEYQGHYFGYDENGDGRYSDWHGYTKNRKPVGWIGTAIEAPFTIDWNTSMLPYQGDMAVKARVVLKKPEGVCYETPVLTGLSTPERSNFRVSLHLIANPPTHFWSRAGRLKTAWIPVDLDPAKIESARLHVKVWDGGAGHVAEYFKLNGHFFPVAGKGRHDTLYSIVEIPPSIIKQGNNLVELLSDTEHHGIEILLPGPALVIRSRH